MPSLRNSHIRLLRLNGVMPFRYSEQQTKAMLESLLMSAVYMEKEYRRDAMEVEKFSTDPGVEGVMQGALQKTAQALREMADGEKKEQEELRQALRSLGLRGSHGTGPSTSEIRGSPISPGPSAAP